jgi:hypothetical protein
MSSNTCGESSPLEVGGLSQWHGNKSPLGLAIGIAGFEEGISSSAGTELAEFWATGVAGSTGGTVKYCDD